LIHLRCRLQRWLHNSDPGFLSESYVSILPDKPEFPTPILPIYPVASRHRLRYIAVEIALRTDALFLVLWNALPSLVVAVTMTLSTTICPVNVLMSGSSKPIYIEAHSIVVHHLSWICWAELAEWLMISYSH
jgi:hypothetical protein